MKRLLLILPKLIALIGLSLIMACSGPPNRLPFKTLSTATDWRLLHHYEYRGSIADRKRISPAQRVTVGKLREDLKGRAALEYNNYQAADITVTLEERQRSSGYGQVNGLNRREFFWWLRFYDKQGKLLAEYTEARQHLMRQTDNQPLVDALAEQIINALRGEKIRL